MTREPTPRAGRFPWLNPARSSQSARFMGCVPSTSGCALRAHVERIEGVARCHEQTVAPHPAETDVGTALGERNEADRFSGGIENLHSILLGTAHAPAAPEIAFDVAAEPVGRAARLGCDEGAAIGELIVVNVVD